MTFLNFLKNNLDRTNKKLIYVENHNVKNPKKNLSSVLINTKKDQKSYMLESDEDNWLTTKNSSCRYDDFITMFVLSINQI